MRTLVLFLALVGLGASQYAAAQYLPFADAERRIGELARQHPDLIKLETVGTSAGGRKILALTVAAKGPVDPAQRPAIFVGANIVGYHNAGTQAALALVEKFIANKAAPILASRTFYILPILNPDAHDSMFAKVKWRNSLNGAKLDRDVDGLVGEDGPDDLDADGRITQLRIPDPHGDYLADPADPRVMRRADPLKGESGQFRLLGEGIDNDRDGQFNEDPAGGYRPDKNFAHAFNDADPESGVFASSTPEARAVMDFLLARRNVAFAFVFGPGNNLLDLPRSTGGANAADVGSVRVRPPGFLVTQLGLEANTDYTVDEIWNRLQGSPFLAQAGPQFTKEALASFLGAGPATSPAQEDSRYFQNLSADYKKALDAAGLDSRRAGRQSQIAGLQNWLYYQYGVMVAELDVWGIPKKKAAPAPPAAAGLTGDAADLMDYIDQNNKQAFAPWTAVTLPDGRKAEVGGVDPFVEIAPPAAELLKATGAHADFITAVAARTAKIEILSTEAKPLADGLWRVTATAGNTGFLPTHTAHGARIQTWLPVRLELGLAAGVTLVSGRPQARAERLTGGTGTLKGEWLVRATKGSRLKLSALTQNAGTDQKEIVLQ